MILIITNEQDITSDYIILELKRRKIPFIRLNTENLPKYTLTFDHQNPGREWTLESSNFNINLGDVTAAYYRRPGEPDIRGGYSTEWDEFSKQEWSAALKSIISYLQDRFINPPQKISEAEDKPRQLVHARNLGFNLPKTKIGNNPQIVNEQLSSNQCIAKPLRQALVGENENELVIFTSELPCDLQLSDFEIHASPFILQQKIEKQSDIRVTVVADEVFAVKILSQDYEDTQVDWRKGSRTDLKHEPHRLSKEIEQQCISLTKSLGLRFGAIDLILDTTKKYWFLEINPNGQWAWIENKTGLPISKKICDMIENQSKLYSNKNKG